MFEFLLDSVVLGVLGRLILVKEHDAFEAFDKLSVRNGPFWLAMHNPGKSGALKVTDKLFESLLALLVLLQHLHRGRFVRTRVAS